MKTNEKEYSKDLLDILRGYSILSCSGKDYFFKHFLFIEILELEEQQRLDIKDSIKNGIQKESKLIEKAIETGGWSKQEEDKISSLKWTIKKSTTAMSKIQDPKQREVFNAQIEGEREQLSKLQKKRNGIVSYSAESLAEVKKIQRMVSSCIFYDKKFKKRLGDDEPTGITATLFNRFAELNQRERILGASYHGGFFDTFAAQHRNPLQLFGSKFTDLTVFQKNLLALTNTLFNKIKNVSIPDEISDDPIKILEYEEKEEKESKVSHGVGDLKRKVAARGGELKAEDFLS